MGGRVQIEITPNRARPCSDGLTAIESADQSRVRVSPIGKNKRPRLNREPRSNLTPRSHHSIRVGPDDGLNDGLNPEWRLRAVASPRLRWLCWLPRFLEGCQDSRLSRSCLLGQPIDLTQVFCPYCVCFNPGDYRRHYDFTGSPINRLRLPPLALHQFHCTRVSTTSVE